MKITRVQYTVQDDYVETNKRNIEQVMADLRDLNNAGIKYSSYQLEDHRTFMHFAVFPDDETSKILSDLKSFNKSRQELKASQPEVPPKAESLTMVASAFDWF